MSASSTTPVVDPRTLIEPLVPLEAVITTAELARRPSRPADFALESRALVELTEAMALQPGDVLQKLAETALRLCRAGSAGISIIEEEDGRKIFRWRALAGALSGHLLGTTPREFSPCGTVVDRSAVMLMTNLDRHYRYFAEVEPRILEALLVPFSVGDQTIGTVWVVSHDESARFDAEDGRLIGDLGKYASAAWQVCTLHSTPALADDTAGNRPAGVPGLTSAMRLVARNLAQDLARNLDVQAEAKLRAARADLARLMFLVDGLIERQRSESRTHS